MKFRNAFPVATLLIASILECRALNVFTQDAVESEKEMITCTLYRVEGMMINPDVPGFDRIRCKTQAHGSANVTNIPTSFLSDDGKIKSGQIQITVPLSMIKDGSIDMTKDDINFNPRQNARFMRPSTQAYYRVVVVRVIDKNGDSPAKSAAELSDDVFGTDGDSYNLASGYKRCSGNKLNIVPATGEGIVNGVLELNFGIRMAGRDMEDVESWVSDKFDRLEHKYRYSHRMYVLPASVDFGYVIAYAELAGYTSVFSDGSISYPSVAMHEFLHNLDFDHSTRGSSEYGDRTCLMGLNLPWADDGPRACFNGAKSWELGWYSDRHLRVDPRTESFQGKLISIDDYLNKKATSDDEKTVIRIEGLGDKDLFLIYNRAKGVNAGVNMFRNKVTIVAQTYYNGFSYWRTALSDGEEYTSGNWNQSGKRLVIKVCKTGKGKIDYASVLIYLNKLNNLSCPLECGSDREFAVRIKNDHKTKLRYFVQKRNSGSKGKWGKHKLMRKNLKKKELWLDSQCLDPKQCYRFKIFDYDQKGGLKSGGYTLYWKGEILRESDFKEGPTEFVTFGDC